MITNRRQFIATTALAIPFITRAAPPAAKIIEAKIISTQTEFYHGWPTVAQRKNGELWVTCSGGREAHVCPFGKVVAMKSTDHGGTWSAPRVIYDGPIDDRDSGVLETEKGTLLVTTFTSLAYEDSFKKAAAMAELTDKGWVSKAMPADRYARWKAAHEKLSDAERQAQLGEWVLRSADGGETWSKPIPTIVNSPHGPVQLKDGRLLYAGKQLWSGDKKIGVAESKDDGLTWQWLAEIPTRQGDDATKSYHELHAIEAADGTLIAQIRNHNAANKGETLQSESTDGGKTWSLPHSIGVWGLPSHLLRLRDGRLVMSYGHRRKPFGNQARISNDNGKTWGEAIILSGDGIGGDLGYPSTVELPDGTLLSVWYEKMADLKLAVLRQATWRLE